MRNLIIGILAVALLAAGWFFVSPLFLDEVVEEDFLARLPTMSDAEKLKMKPQIMEAAANKPDLASMESMPDDGPVLIARGTFKDADAIHKGSGDALVYKLADEQHLVRLEKFRATNGPALVVYLAEHPSPTDAGHVSDGGFVSLGKLKGNVGNQNYPVPAGTDIGKYNSVVIWCELFDVLFSPAALNPVN